MRYIMCKLGMHEELKGLSETFMHFFSDIIGGTASSVCELMAIDQMTR